MVYFQNVRGLRTKLQLLYENISYSQYDIVVLNETWLTHDMDSAELRLFDYDVYRKDRSRETSDFSRGGGVLIAVRKTITSSFLSVGGGVEHLFVKIDLDGGDGYVLATAYLPPRSTPEKYIEFAGSVDDISERCPGYKLCIGIG